MKGSGGQTSRGRHNRSRASKFRRSNESKQIIKLVGINGKTRTVRQRGHMNITSHSSVLQALSHQASKFDRSRRGNHDDTHTPWSIDESDTLIDPNPDMDSNNEILQQEIREINSIQVPEEVLCIHGFAPPSKPEGTV